MFSNAALQEISISNDNADILCDDLRYLIEAQDMFSAEDAADILRKCSEQGTSFQI